MVKESSWTAESPTGQFNTLDSEPVQSLYKKMPLCPVMLPQCEPLSKSVSKRALPSQLDRRLGWGLCREKITERVIGFGIIDQGGMSPADFYRLHQPDFTRGSRSNFIVPANDQEECGRGIQRTAYISNERAVADGNLQSGSVIRRAKSPLCFIIRRGSLISNLGSFTGSSKRNLQCLRSTISIGSSRSQPFH
jgi:hypothetical protein